MKRKITIETDENKITEVKTCWDPDEVNVLLKTGVWFVQHGGACHKGQGGYQAKPCWIMAKRQTPQKEMRT